MPALPPVTSSPAPSAAHLRVDGVSRSFPDRRVLTDVTFTVSARERACLVGENGSGKSTLLRIIAGLDQPDAGSVVVPGSLGLFHQRPPYGPDLSVADVFADATAPLHALVRALEVEGEAMAAGVVGADVRFDRALADAERRRAWDVEQLVDRLVHGLGLAGIPRDRRAGDLSGGENSRLSLAWVLVRRPDTLLLDEPTNHLDDGAATLLAELLTGWSGPVLMASHDRAFVDEVATTLLDLDPAALPHARVRGDADSPGSGFGVTRFSGTLSAYLQAREAEQARWQRRYRDEQDELARLRARLRADHRVGHANREFTAVGVEKKFFADRNAKVVARRVNDAASALARLEADQVRRPPEPLRFRGLAGRPSGRSRSAGPVLVATRVQVPDRLPPTSLALAADARLLVTGPNGAGKSTLLAVVAGRIAPSAGTVTPIGRLSVGLLGQDVTPRDPNRSVLDSYRDAVGDRAAERTPLATLGLLAGRDEQRPVASLSLGQQRRLDLAILLAHPPDVLLLDEPANHFSPRLAAELVAALPDYPGAVVVASHDRWLRRSWRGEVLELG